MLSGASQPGGVSRDGKYWLACEPHPAGNFSADYPFEGGESFVAEADGALREKAAYLFRRIFGDAKFVKFQEPLAELVFFPSGGPLRRLNVWWDGETVTIRTNQGCVWPQS